MSSRIVFLDIDGTYASHGAVPPAHADAVRAARANGHRVLLCTGRPRATVSDRLLSAGFDGVVAGAGAYAEVDGTVLRDETLPPALASRAIEALDRHRAVLLVESTEAMYVRADARAVMDARAPGSGSSQEEVWRDLLEATRLVETFDGIGFAKVVSLGADIPLADIASEIGPEVAAVETSIRDLGTGAGELYLAHVTKAVGVEAVLDHLGLSPADAIGIGDGPNDLEMLEAVGTAVGIEGGHPGVVSQADLVVPGPEQSGLVEAFRTLGLI